MGMGCDKRSNLPTSWFGDGRDKWPWLDHSSQTPAWHESPNKPEQISVAAAQHATTFIGRGYSKVVQPAVVNYQSGAGIYFSEQWQRTLEVDPSFVLVTGWNGWIAQRFIDPMKGGFGDVYYYKMVANIRKYKGTRALPAIQQSGEASDFTLNSAAAPNDHFNYRAKFEH